MKKTCSAISHKKTFCILLATVCILAIFFGTMHEVYATENDNEIEYIFFDLAAGKVSISGNSYSGSAYKNNGDGTFTLTTISGTLQENQAYYVYQSVGGVTSPDGYFVEDSDGAKSFILPQRTPVTVDGQSWGDYITNNSDVEAVISSWITEAGNASRQSTPNTVTITGKVNATMVIDNLWSSFHEKDTSKKTGGISFCPQTANSHLTIKTKGDNRFGNIFYSNNDTTTSLTFEEQEENSSLTVANLKNNSNENYWCAAIGGNDSGLDAALGLIFNGGTIFAGTNAKDDCTAIGGGGNGYGGITINGGRITAAVTSSGAAIGGGIGKTSNGGQADVIITGGEVYAYNFSCSSGTYSKQGVAYIPAAAIGGGSSAQAVCNACTVTITGGRVYAQSVGGTAIGGGSSADNNGGSATVTIGGNAYVEAKSIAGTISGNEVPAGVSIGGGTGGKADSKNGGNVTLTIKDNPTVIVGSIGGGKTISPSGTIGSATVTITGGTIQGQIIMAAGSSSKCSFNMSGGTINNSGREETFVFLEENGGAIFMDDPKGVAELSGGSISSCIAENGGALYMTAGEFKLSGTGIITSCSATQNGGAVYMGGGTLTMSGGTISSNTAINGAGAYLAEGTMNISGGTVSNNIATQNGGAAYLGGGEMTVSGGTISNNSAVNGAGAYLSDGTMTVSEGSVTENKASQNGGAIYLGGGTFNVSGGSLHNNSALQNGGAAYLGGGDMTVLGGTISENTAVNGAGAYLADGMMTVSGGKIYKNTASQDGGGAYLAGGSFTVTDGTISENTAINGAGALVANGNVTVTGGKISENKATQNGGAFSITNGNYTMTGGEITLNKAINGDGGAIYVSSSQDNTEISIRSGSIISNEAGKSGGALGVYGQKGVKFTITVGSNTDHTDKTNCHICADNDQSDEPCPIISKNTSYVSGGAIYLSGSYDAVMNMYCLVESDNQVGNGVSNSNFMKVEGGTLNITSLGPNGENNYGKIVITSSFHVTGGKVTLDGLVSNPMFTKSITVDVDSAEGSTFTDKRKGDNTYTVQYFENFEEDGQVSGRYTLIDLPAGAVHTIRPAMYSHTGYAIDGWVLQSDKVLYTAGTDIKVDKDLVFYAKWSVVGYTVVFTPGVDSYRGSMDPQDFAYSDSKALTENAFINVGFIFDHWVDASDSQKTYTNGQVVSALSETHGTTVTLIAVWKICDHNDTHYTITATDNSATRECSCLGYHETASLESLSTVYDENPHGRSVVYDRETLNGLYPTEMWNFTVLYNGTSNGGEVLTSSTIAPRNAGNYTATVKVTEDITISVSITIARANRSEVPNAPQYTTTVDKKGTATTDDDVNIIKIEDPKDTTGLLLEYQFSWYKGEELEYSGWLAWDVDNPPTQHLKISYTNYYVEVRYAETDNYKASSVVRGAKIFWVGNVTFTFSAVPGLSYSYVPSEEKGGIEVTLTPLEGYYIYNITPEIAEIPNYVLPTMENRTTTSDSWVIWIHSIAEANNSDGVTIEISFKGVEKLITVDSSTVKNEVFESIKAKGEENVTISRDSAYTVYFDIQNYNHYENPSISFSSTIPAGSTVIMVDHSNSSYWSYTERTDVESVLLIDFVRMGSSNESFVVDNKDSFSLQFIVDFSSCENVPAINSITTSFIATAIQPTGLETVPGVPNGENSVSTVTLVSVPTFSVQAGAEASGSLTQTLQYSFISSSTNNVGASKWNNTCGILIVTPDGSALPADARLQVRINDVTDTYPLINGRFIIALPANSSGTASITLLSDMLLNENASYQFKVSLCYSQTGIRTTPTNVISNEACSLSYTTTKINTPVINAKITGSLPEYSESAISALSFSGVVQDLPENYSVRGVLYSKNKTGGYTSTTQTIDITVTDGTFATSLDLSSFKDDMSQTNGSLSLMLRVEIVDTNGKIVDFVPLYFVLIDTRPITAKTPQSTLEQS